uniref:Uncharacterized protein n=1 Tax=Anguilla anguilla TaxID=7936 RepID=A0A0E9RCT3_ANGAN
MLVASVVIPPRHSSLGLLILRSRKLLLNHATKFWMYCKYAIGGDFWSRHATIAMSSAYLMEVRSLLFSWI